MVSGDQLSVGTNPRNRKRVMCVLSLSNARVSLFNRVSAVDVAQSGVARFGVSVGSNVER